MLTLPIIHTHAFCVLMGPLGLHDMRKNMRFLIVQKLMFHEIVSKQVIIRTNNPKIEQDMKIDDDGVFFRPVLAKKPR